MHGLVSRYLSEFCVPLQSVPAYSHSHSARANKPLVPRLLTSAMSLRLFVPLDRCLGPVSWTGVCCCMGVGTNCCSVQAFPQDDLFGPCCCCCVLSPTAPYSQYSVICAYSIVFIISIIVVIIIIFYANQHKACGRKY